jgi:hypothetical protein
MLPCCTTRGHNPDTWRICICIFIRMVLIAPDLCLGTTQRNTPFSLSQKFRVHFFQSL